MASEQERLRTELAELNAYRDSLKKIGVDIKTLQAERDTCSLEQRANYDQKIQELEQDRQQKWSELGKNYNVHEGLMKDYHKVTKGGPVYAPTTTGDVMSYTGNPDVLQQTTLGNAIREREAQLRVVERSQPPAPPPVPHNGDPGQQVTHKPQAAHQEQHPLTAQTQAPLPTHHERESHPREMGGYQMADESEHPSAVLQQPGQRSGRFIDRFKEDTPQEQPPPPTQAPTPPEQHPSTQQPSQQPQAQPNHFIDRFTQIGDHPKDMEQGIEQIKADMREEQQQRQPPQWKTPFRQLFEQRPEPPSHQEPEHDRSR